MPHLILAKNLWQSHLKQGDTAVDATCGNGHDAYFLAELLKEGFVACLDIQQAAIQKTSARFSPEQQRRVALYQRSHAEIDAIPLPTPPRLIVYNLGYLPGGNKALVTQTKTTLESVEKSMRILAEDGAISITCYPGHPEGEIEESALLSFAAKLPSHEWLVCHHRWLNRPRSPSLLWIARKVSSFTHEQPSVICGLKEP